MGQGLYAGGRRAYKSHVGVEILAECVAVDHLHEMEQVSTFSLSVRGCMSTFILQGQSMFVCVY